MKTILLVLEFSKTECSNVLRYNNSMRRANCEKKKKNVVVYLVDVKFVSGCIHVYMYTCIHGISICHDLPIVAYEIDRVINVYATPYGISVIISGWLTGFDGCSGV